MVGRRPTGLQRPVAVADDLVDVDVPILVELRP